MRYFLLHRRSKRLAALIGILFLYCTSHALGQKAQSDSLRISEYPTYESFLPGAVVKFGIQTGFIVSDKYDTGVDLGVRVSQNFFHPYFLLTSQIHFWTATKDNTDIGVTGIEESLTYRIPFNERMYVFGGFSVGYLGVIERKIYFEGDTERENEEKSYGYEKFLTFGLEYALKGNRSLFIQGKYGTTSLCNEMHFVFGLNFHRTPGVLKSK